jgi:hypothetical protein
MTLLERVQHGRQRRPITACIYGVPGVGKTTFGAAAPNPLMCCIERGAEHLDVSKLPPPESWDAFLTDLRELATAEHGFKSIVIDTLDALEPLAVAAICTQHKKDTLADFSWGGGYALLQAQWRLLLSALERLRDVRGMNIILIAHEHRKAYSDPELGSFEMYRPKLQEKAWAVTNEWCDAVLFAQFDQALFEKDGQRARAIVSGRRVLRTQRGTGYVAKNRYGLEPTIDLDWKTFERAATPVGIDELRAKYLGLLEKVPSDVREKATTFVKERGETPEVLRAITERMLKMSAEKAA